MMAPEGLVLLEPPSGWKPAWLQSPQANKIFAALGGDHVRFVGGSVRDSLLGRDVADLDLATTHEPDDTTKLLEAVGIKVVPTGLAHGTITAVVDGQTFEITSLRKDVSTDGRHATVAFTKNWLEDAHRRDFTINALYATQDGRIFDPFGGFDDLQSGIVRFIGNAEDRIKEDALRIYRFFRFSARYAKSIDEAGLRACAARAGDAKNLSRERVRDELLKLLTLSDPRHFVQAMQTIQILPNVGEVSADRRPLCEAIEREARLNCQSAPVTRLGLMYVGATAKKIASAFRLSKKQEQFVGEVRQVSEALPGITSVRPLLYSFGSEVINEALASFEGDLRVKFLDELDNWENPEFPVSGKDLLQLGFGATSALGKLLKELEKEWVKGDFAPTKRELLAKASEKL